MRDILPDLIHWRKEGKSIALATVIQTWGSSPRTAGSRMGITQDGKITGSVSGGCVENAVVEAAMQTLRTHQPQLLHFGVADETAWSVGLACGGSLNVFVNPLDPDIFEPLCKLLTGERTAMLVTVLRGPEDLPGRELLLDEGGQIAGSLPDGWQTQALEAVQASPIRERISRIDLNPGSEICIEQILPSPTLIIVGGAHIAIGLVAQARALGYRTILIDPRQVWANSERFPHVDQLIQAWPSEAFDQIQVTPSTAIVTLTHDPKLDDPALKIALSSPAFYVGALGSQRTHVKRHQRLSQEGLNEIQLARLHAPIGLNIGAQSPEEIALSIMAEVVDALRKRTPASVQAETQRVTSS